MPGEQLTYQMVRPPLAIADFVERFWMLASHSSQDHEIIVLPDGRIDIFFVRSARGTLTSTLKGLETGPSATAFPGDTVYFAVNLKLLAVEYLLGESIAGLLNIGRRLPTDFWGIESADLDDFDRFCNKLSDFIATRIAAKVDNRKKELFDLVDATNGSLLVKEMAEKVYWSSRQVNRYFNQYFGLSLKAYCTILRFRASFPHIREGKLFPEQNFADQAHFIKEVKRLSGVLPKDLAKNKNDRFLQFSTLKSG